MDAVYVCRDGENPELRYSLRTLTNVDHDRVWVFGGAPKWLNTDTVTHRLRKQEGGSRFASTRGHITAACNDPEVSDPFMLWNDDFYAMEKISPMPIYHRGLLVDQIHEMARHRTPWVMGLRATAGLLKKHGMLDGALSYDLHVPLIIHKAEMLEAFELAKRASVREFHPRTLYGVTAGIGGEEHIDPKIERKTDPFPCSPWLSSSPNTFRSTVEPVLRYLFSEPSQYEQPPRTATPHP